MATTYPFLDHPISDNYHYPPRTIFAATTEDYFLCHLIMSPGNVEKYKWLKPKAFYQKKAAALWTAILSGATDLNSLMLCTPESDKDYVMRVLQNTNYSWYPEILEDWAKTIATLHTQRKLEDISGQLSILARQKDFNPQLAIQQAIALIGSVAHEGTSDEITMRSHQVAAKEYLSDVAAARKAQRVLKYNFGWPEVDKLTGGIRPGQLITIGARSSMGKSTFALNAAVNVANQGIPTLFISLEMTIAELEGKILGQLGHVRGDDYSDPRSIGIETFSKLVASAKGSADLPLHLDDGSYSSATDIEVAVMKLNNDRIEPIKVVFVDYLQLMSLDGGANNMVQAISKLTRELKQLAKKLGIAIVILSQLSRGVESRNDKRPMMSDLRDSGSIEQDSNMILMLYRDAYYNPNTEMGDATEVLIVKNRGGATGMALLNFSGEYSQFS
jgi:replicative DNA helicase